MCAPLDFLRLDLEAIKLGTFGYEFHQYELDIIVGNVGQLAEKNPQVFSILY